MSTVTIALILICIGVPLFFVALLGYSLMVVAGQCDDEEGNRN